MRGSPLLRLVLTAVTLLAAGWTVGWLAQRPAASAAQTPAPAGTTPAAPGLLTLRLTSSAPLETFEIQSGGETLIKRSPGELIWTETLPGNTILESADLLIQASWSGGSEVNALKVEMDLDGRSLPEQTLWGQPDLMDVVALPEPEQP